MFFAQNPSFCAFLDWFVCDFSSFTAQQRLPSWDENQRTAMHSISTRAFLGKVFTATAERAGKGAEK